ncbi:MAG: hypothetical protein ACTSWJ_02330 [Candidatus Heimdallarchaeaceae archaeon]
MSDPIAIPILVKDSIDKEEICFNCDHGCNGGGISVTCMGPTPWRGEEKKFDGRCGEFTNLYFDFKNERNS